MVATEDIIGTIDHRIKKLEERYPFTADELEILCRCHDHLQNENDHDDFLMKLARTSPYQFFFVPGDELRDRVNFIEDYILPAGFASQMRTAVTVDTFVIGSDPCVEKSLACFLEGVANAGRRGSKEALSFLYHLLRQPEPEEITDICFRLMLASNALVTPTLDKSVTLQQVEQMQQAAGTLGQALRSACNDGMTLSAFIAWAEMNVPMLCAPLSMFVHNLLFHGHPLPQFNIPYISPRLVADSNILCSPMQNPLLMNLSMTSRLFGEKVCF